KHATSALYNSVEHRRIPMRFIWQPLAKIQDGLGGKTRAILYSIAAALVVLIAVMIFVPYPLKMDAKGQLLPIYRQYVYSPMEAKVIDFLPGLEQGSVVSERQQLIHLYDLQLEQKITTLDRDVATAQGEIDGLNQQLANAPPAEKPRLLSERRQK